MFRRLLKSFAGLFRTWGNPRAKYDAAQKTGPNKNHWTLADGLSAGQANSRDVRRTLTQRARYETANNCWLRGMVDTKADDIIGTGPRLQMTLTPESFAGTVSPEEAAKWSRLIERKFAAWMKAARIPKKLHTMSKAKTQDGEAFAVFTHNPKLKDTVKLDLKLLECEQVYNDDFDPQRNQADGIDFDEWGNPERYHVQPHPGDALAALNPQTKFYDGDDVIHLFRCDRPGQVRGIPEITPALVIAPQLRRFTSATVGAAEHAASYAGVVTTTNTADETAGSDAAWAEIDFHHRGFTVLPDGADLKQLKAEHPTTNHQMFVRSNVTEIGRCIGMPYIIAAGDASNHNYSSGRMDHQTYFLSIRVERALEWEVDACDVIFQKWFDEAVLHETDILNKIPPIVSLDHVWYWDRREHVDPVKEAQARQIDLLSGCTTYALVYGAMGLDWEEQRQQRAKEVKRDIDLGLATTVATTADHLQIEEDDDDADNAAIERRQRREEESNKRPTKNAEAQFAAA